MRSVPAPVRAFGTTSTIISVVKEEWKPEIFVSTKRFQAAWPMECDALRVKSAEKKNMALGLMNEITGERIINHCFL